MDMSWRICFFAALAVLAISILTAIYRSAARLRWGRVVKPVHILFAGFFSACVLVCLPAFLAQGQGAPMQADKAIVFAFQCAIRVFGADGMYSAILEHVDQAPESLRNAYIGLTMVVQFFSPLLSFAFLFSFFKNLSALARYSLSFFRDVYVFSQLNDPSCLLAADIMKNHPHARVAFAGVHGGDDQQESLLENTREMGAICFKKTVDHINWRFHSRKKALYFFAIGRDELQNVNDAQKLSGRYADRDKTHLYIFSTGVEGKLLLSALKRDKMKVRRVDPVRSLVLRILHEEGGRLFAGARPMENAREKQISAVLVGLGGRGSEMLKGLSWYCQMDGYRLKIHAFDADPLAGDKLAARCPELMKEKLNRNADPDDAVYDITVHAGCDVETKAFADRVEKIRDATFVFVSLGSDEKNITAAVEMRMLYERMGLHPDIFAVLPGSRSKTILSQATNNAGQPYDITFVGDMASSYTEKVVLDYEMEKEAFARHCAYCDHDPDKMEDFWRYEYNYHSSLAAAIHARARIDQHMTGADKPAEELTLEERYMLERLEHRRWIAYMRSEGYVHSGTTHESGRNHLAKTHHDLVPFEHLPQPVKRTDSRMGAAISAAQKKA